jgi:hypothetical protein
MLSLLLGINFLLQEIVNPIVSTLKRDWFQYGLTAALKSTSTFELAEESKHKIDNRKKSLSLENLKKIEEKVSGM